MGREPSRKGKRLFLYAACGLILFLAIPGCLLLPVKWKEEHRLQTAKALMAGGNYEASLKENKEVLRLFPQTLGDRALFQMGLLYAHPENPNSDYKKSLESFQSLIREFPNSDKREEARLWVLVHQEIISKNTDITKLNGRIDFFEKELEKNKKKGSRRISTLQGRIAELQAQIKSLKGQMERLKKVDLGIEEKKRKVLPK